MAMIITVDGPSGVGKGTLCHALARHFDFDLLDSGALYRIAAFAANNAKIDIKDEILLSSLVDKLEIKFALNGEGINVWLNDKEISQQIRTQEIGEIASKIAVFPMLRFSLLALQRNFAGSKGLIADGRDMGTVVFPNAPIKFFLDAAADERARRRYLQLQQKGISVKFEQIFNEIKLRDQRDREREIAPLVPAKDAFVMDSTDLSIESVLKIAIDRITRYMNVKN